MTDRSTITVHVGILPTQYIPTVDTCRRCLHTPARTENAAKQCHARSTEFRVTVARVMAGRARFLPARLTSQGTNACPVLRLCDRKPLFSPLQPLCCRCQANRLTTSYKVCTYIPYLPLTCTVPTYSTSQHNQTQHRHRTAVLPDTLVLKIPPPPPPPPPPPLPPPPSPHRHRHRHCHCHCHSHPH